MSVTVALIIIMPVLMVVCFIIGWDAAYIKHCKFMVNSWKYLEGITTERRVILPDVAEAFSYERYDSTSNIPWRIK